MGHHGHVVRRLLGFDCERMVARCAGRQLFLQHTTRHAQALERRLDVCEVLVAQAQSVLGTRQVLQDRRVALVAVAPHREFVRVYRALKLGAHHERVAETHVHARVVAHLAQLAKECDRIFCATAAALRRRLGRCVRVAQRVVCDNNCEALRGKHILRVGGQRLVEQVGCTQHRLGALRACIRAWRHVQAQLVVCPAERAERVRIVPRLLDCVARGARTAKHALACVRA